MTKKRQYKRKYRSTLFIGVLFLFLFAVKAQQPPPRQVSSADAEVKIIDMRRAGKAYKRIDFEPMILVDTVVFFHEGAFMYCDSAHLYENSNTFEAFDNVRMVQGDTIFVYGDYLHYDGGTQLARLRDNIRMEDRTATLFTDSLNYDRLANLGYYFEGGMLVDDQNELTSFWGQYDPASKDALFSDSVKLVNEQYTIFADTLKYNTDTKIADILGPSEIVSNSGYIRTTRGWYNTDTDDARLYDRSQVYSNDATKILVGDTIFYNRQTGNGEVFGDMFLHDTARKAILKGNYGFYNEKTEYGMATDSAYAIDYSQKDSLFVHGDTLILVTDSTYRDLKAFYNVRFYRQDIQGITDSMSYVSKDSVLYMIGNPVLWNNNNQILGNQIDIHLNDSTIDKAHVKDYALAIQERPEKNQYNQLSGRDLTASFRNGNLHNILVEGNAESLYYIMDDDSLVIGLNKTESAFLSMDIKDDQIERIKLWSSTNAVTTPLPQLKPEDSRLTGFTWLHYLRPRHARDIFRRNQRSSADEATPSPRRFVREQESL